MITIRNYADLIRKIELLKTQVKLNETELDFWFGEDTPFHSKGTIKHGINTAVNQTDRVIDNLNELRSLLDYYKKVKKEMDKYIQSFEGLEHQILYKKIVENKTYKEIADELGYSHIYIRQIASRTNNKRTESIDIV